MSDGESSIPLHLQSSRLMLQHKGERIRMLYRNKKTGLELELKSVIISPDFEPVSEKKEEPCENISDEEMFSEAPVE